LREEFPSLSSGDQEVEVSLRFAGLCIAAVAANMAIRTPPSPGSSVSVSQA
jgi:hypothetical protein